MKVLNYFYILIFIVVWINVYNSHYREKNNNEFLQIAEISSKYESAKCIFISPNSCLTVAHIFPNEKNQVDIYIGGMKISWEKNILDADKDLAKISVLSDGFFTDFVSLSDLKKSPVYIFIQGEKKYFPYEEIIFEDKQKISLPLEVYSGESWTPLFQKGKCVGILVGKNFENRALFQLVTQKILQ